MEQLQLIPIPSLKWRVPRAFKSLRQIAQPVWISRNWWRLQLLQKDVQHIHPDSLKSTQEMIETMYQDVFQGLGKFHGEPYKLRLKENYVPAKHQPWKVPVHLQDAFHEEVQWLIKIDVLEPVTEQTEWVNSYVIVGKKWRLIQAMPTVWATQSRRFNCV